MSGYTLRTPNTILTTLLQDGQASGSIIPVDLRDGLMSGQGVQINTQTASYTLVLTDAFLCVEMNVATANTLTVPPNSSVAFQIGTVIEWYQMGAGQITFTPGAGVTLRNASSLTSRVQFSSGAIRKRATDEWVVMGDVT
jgi:hypothetical protein